MAHEKHPQPDSTEPVKGGEQGSNDPGGKPPVETPPGDGGGLIDTQTPIPQFEPEPHGETATGSVVPFSGGEAVIVDNPSDMAHEYAEARLDLGSNRFIRLPGVYAVEKKR